MSLLRDILRQYWANLLAIGVFVRAFERYCCFEDAFAMNRHLEGLIFAFVGMVMFVGSEVWRKWANTLMSLAGNGFRCRPGSFT